MRAVLLAVCLVLLAAACGGGSRASSTQPSNALAYAHCVRAHGVARYPDPDGRGQLVKESLQQLGVSSARFQSAESACRHLMPNGGRPPNQARQQQVRAQSLRFAQCVRAHGVPDFPDPDGTGRIPEAWPGVDQGSPRFEAANRACATYRPPYVPSNAAYDAWARTHPNGS